MAALESFKYFRVTIESFIAEVVMNRPDKLNSMDDGFFEELGRIFRDLDTDERVRVIILWAEGKLFTAGLDLKFAATTFVPSNESFETHVALWKHLKKWQNHFKSILDCKKPVIAAVHGQCIGGGIDMISFADYRVATIDAKFSIKETKLGITADLGTLQRIAKITSKGFAREMAFTGEPVDASRAFHFGFLNQVFSTKEEMLNSVREQAKIIASNSPVVVQGTKIALNYADEHSTEDSLNQISLWNSAFLRSPDLYEAIGSFFEKRKPVFKSRL